MKALFIGLGGVGQRHLRNLLQLRPNTQICAIRRKGKLFEISNTLEPNYDIDITKKYNITVYSNFIEALTFKPNFAVVANPSILHLETCQRLLDANIPVLIEKPLSSNSEGIDELLNCSKTKKLPVIVGYQMRYHPCAQKIKKYLDQKALGKLFSVQVTTNSFMPSWHSYESYKDFYVGKKGLGGGVVLTEIHEIDLLHWYFGPPKQLWAVGGTLSDLDVDVEDTVDVLLNQEIDGYHLPISVHMCFVQQPPSRQIIIRGEKGTLTWDIERGLLLNNAVDKVQEHFTLYDFDRNQLFVDLMADFLAGLWQGNIPLTALDKVIGGHRTALAIKESLATNRVVTLK